MPFQKGNKYRICVGHTPWSKGKILSEEHKRKMSESLKGHGGYSEESRKKISEAHKGIPRTEETKKKLSEAHKGFLHSEKTRLKMSKSHRGEKNPSWKGGITSENIRIRNNIEIRLWREAVFARDNWTCQKCKQRGYKLISHHIFGFSIYPDLRVAIDNGITFCKECHFKFHKIYGKKNNTKEQLEEFLEREIN